MTVRGNALSAIHHCEPEFVPVDYRGTEIITDKLIRHFGLRSADELDKHLGSCIRTLGPELRSDLSAAQFFYEKPGPKLSVHPFGMIRKWGPPDSFGDTQYEEIPRLKGDLSVSDIEALTLPVTEWYDFSNMNERSDDSLTFYNAGSYLLIAGGLRGLDHLFLDMAGEPEIARALLRRVQDMMHDFAEKALVGGQGNLDMVRIGSDFASKSGLMISLPMFREFFLPNIRKMCDLIHRHNALVFFHCCGAMSELIPDLINAGVDILDPVQTVLPGMDPKRLKQEFGNDITFHGGVDTLDLIPNGSVQEVKDAVQGLQDTLGKRGGYIMAASNGFRSDASLENVLACFNRLPAMSGRAEITGSSATSRYRDH